MRCTGVDRSRAVLHQSVRSLYQRSRGVDQIVDDQAGPPVNVADHVHYFGNVNLDPAFVDNGQGCIHFLGEKPRPFHAAGIRRNHRQIRQRQLPEVIDQHRRREQVIDRNIEKALQLRRMQIHNQRPMRTSGRQQIGHQLRRNRAARLVLAILPGVPEVRNHRCDTPRRSALERIDHQQQLHQMLVHRTAGRLHHENIRAAHVLLNLNVTLAVPKADYLCLPALHPKEVTDLISQRLVRRTAEDLELLVGSRTLLPLELFIGHRRALLLNGLVGRRHQSSHSF